MTKKEKALKLASELGLTIFKAHASHVAGCGNHYYYIIKHRDAANWDDFREHANPSRYFTHFNKVKRHMMRDSWGECYGAMQDVIQELEE